ncbi:MAG: hypothetical protein ABSC26_06740 [Stellaceae bacterium]|jgi:hypothetical protein
METVMKHGALALIAASLSGALLTGTALAQIAPGAAPVMGAPPHTFNSGDSGALQAQPPQEKAPQTAAVSADQDHVLSGQRETQALNLLEAQGYGNFTDFRAEGANFAATVSDPNGQYTVLVNPDNGQVIRR